MSKNYIYMEDLSEGTTFTSGPITMSEVAIIKYAEEFDPQDFHISLTSAKNTAFGELVASGWHTASVTMRLMIDAIPPIEGGMVGRAVENMNWPRPVRPNDQLWLESAVLSVTPSKTNLKRGTARIHHRTYNQRGDTVMEMVTVIMIPRKD